MNGGANLTGPEVIRDFRAHLATFLQVGAATLGGSAGGVARVRDWLAGEQQGHWKRQVVRHEDAYQEARRAWLIAEDEVRAGPRRGVPDRQSSMEERLVMDRARRQREAAEEKLALVRRWLNRLDQDCAPLIHQVRGHDLALHDQGKRALTQLDRLAGQVEDYLDRPKGSSAAAIPLPPEAVQADMPAGSTTGDASCPP